MFYSESVTVLSPFQPPTINFNPLIKCKAIGYINGKCMACIWHHGVHAGGTTQRNMLLIPMLVSAVVDGWHCPPHLERLIASQEYSR